MPATTVASAYDDGRRAGGLEWRRDHHTVPAMRLTTPTLMFAVDVTRSSALTM